MANGVVSETVLDGSLVMGRRPPESLAADAWRRFRRHRLATFGAGSRMAVGGLAGLAVERLIFLRIYERDITFSMAVTFVFACLVVLFNLIADVLYGWLDPRITLG